MEKVFLVGVGGFLGAVARFGVYLLSRSFIPSAFPVPTLVINVAGCFAVGVFFESMREHPLFPSLSLFFAVGFLGSFTTFSTFGLESLDLIRGQHHALAILNLGANTFLGLAAVACGSWIASSGN